MRSGLAAYAPLYVTLNETFQSGLGQSVPVGTATATAPPTATTAPTATTMPTTSPTATVAATATPTGMRVPTDKEQCKDDGWRNFGAMFRNQGQCVSFVNTGR